MRSYDRYSILNRTVTLLTADGILASTLSNPRDDKDERGHRDVASDSEDPFTSRNHGTGSVSLRRSPHRSGLPLEHFDQLAPYLRVHDDHGFQSKRVGILLPVAPTTDTVVAAVFHDAYSVRVRVCDYTWE